MNKHQALTDSSPVTVESELLFCGFYLKYLSESILEFYLIHFFFFPIFFLEPDFH